MNSTSNILVQPIAFVINKYKEIKGKIPKDAISEIVIVADIPKESLTGIEDYSHLEIIFYFHKATNTIKGKAHPRNNKDIPKVGIFAHRNPNRPNHIGLTIVKLIKKEGKKLFVSGLDALDGTPILDIKPVVKHFLPKESIKQPNWINK